MVRTAQGPLREKGVKGFFKYNVFVIIAFLLPALIMAVCFAIDKLAPFGDNMVMVCDAWHQYYPFLRELQTMLKEGVAPVYSWNTGGGSNFLGVIGNYIASPLYLFVRFLPEGQIWLKMYLTLTVVLRIGCAGGFMAIFLRRVFKRNDLSLVYFSLPYAFCGYILGYYWNVMWLDSVALLPLVAAGVYSILKDGKFSLYVISLALCVICNFYIGYFVCIFVLLFCICYTIVRFKSIKHSFKNLGKMVLYTAIAFMLTAFITVPTYMALSHSDSSADAAGFPLTYSINYAYGYDDNNSLMNTIKAILRTATNLLSFTRPITMDKGEPNIFCGALSLVLVVFYFTSKKVKIRERIVSLCLCVFFVLSFVINQLNYIWHGFNTPAMVYYRFSFLFSFVLIVMAYRAFCLIDSISKKAFIASGALLVLYLGVAFIFQRKLSVAITAAAVAVLLLGILLYRKGKLKYKALSVLLCLFVLCESGLSALYGTRVVGYSNGEDYPRQEAAVSELVDFAEEESGGDELYRTEFINSYTLNDGALYSLYGITTFNSMCREDYSDFLTEFGLAASKGNNRYEYVESTPVTNMFLNIKYLVGRAQESTDDEAVMVSEEVTDSTYMNKIAEVDGNYLYENTAYIPMGFMTETTLLDYELYDKSHLPFDTQNEIFSLATGIENDVLIPVEAEAVSGVDLSEMEKNEDLGTYYKYKNIATDDEALYVEYEAPVSGRYYAMFLTSSKEEFVINCGDRQVTDISEYSHILALGACEQGEKITVELPVVEGKSGKLGYFLYYLDEDVFEEGFEKLSQSSMTLTEQTSNGLKGTIDVKEDGLFYTSVLYDEGWKAYVDGEEVEITPVAKTFCAFELSQGEHEIELKFTPEGMYLGIMVSAVGLVAFALIGIIVCKRRKR